MKRIAVFVIPLLISNGIFSQSSYSADIDITIIGEGKVKIAEDATECSTSCNLTSTLAKNTLVAEANSGAVFSGWSGQTCTAGNQVFVDDDMKGVIREISVVFSEQTGEWQGRRCLTCTPLDVAPGRIRCWLCLQLFVPDRVVFT